MHSVHSCIFLATEAAIVGQAWARQRFYNYMQPDPNRARTLPNKMTPAVSSSLIRWALWASRHLHASWMEGRAGEANALLYSSTYPTFRLFVWKQMTGSHSGAFPGQWKTLCGYLNTSRRSRGFTVHTVHWHGGLFDHCHMHWGNTYIRVVFVFFWALLIKKPLWPLSAVAKHSMTV